MRIEDFGFEAVDDRARVFGTVKWEDCGRPDKKVFFETNAEFSRDLSINPHSFLIGGIIPAMHFGEQRVQIDAEVCPEIIEGLSTVMQCLRHWWYAPSHKIPLIETKIKSEPANRKKPNRAGMFFSGGIDSLATIRSNRSFYHLDHPQSIRDGLLVYGLEVADPEAFKCVIDSVTEIAKDCKVTIIPVYTNLRDLNDDWRFWRRSYQGAVFSAIAHAFSNRLDVISISSSHCFCQSPRYGTHPLIDPNYSSSDLQIRHSCYRLSRLEKIQMIADWEAALKNLRVCNQYGLYRTGHLNCGQCEKCLITMTELMAIGALGRTSAFDENDVSADQLKSKIRINDEVEHYYEELIIPLIERGREDLANIIKLKLEDHRIKMEYPILHKYYSKIKLFCRLPRHFTHSESKCTCLKDTDVSFNTTNR